MEGEKKVTYKSIRVPEELVLTVKRIIKEKKDLGYHSHSGFIIDAVRRRVEKLFMNNNYKNNNKNYSAL